MVARKYLYRTATNPANPYVPNFDQSAFETLAGKNTTFMGTTAIDVNMNMQMMQMFTYCYTNPQDPRCASLYQHMNLWLEAYLAAALTTFPQ